MYMFAILIPISLKRYEGGSIKDKPELLMIDSEEATRHYLT